jgi:ribosomal-protein-alanine acetyltransferase
MSYRHNIKEALREDAKEFAKIAALSAGAAQWDATAFLKTVENGNAFKASCDGKTVGFICFAGAGEYIELVNFAVSPRFKRKGIGGSLLKSALEIMARRGVKEIFLEVSQDNDIALSLYERAGFSRVGIRKDFYGRSRNAVIMNKVKEKEWIKGRRGS